MVEVFIALLTVPLIIYGKRFRVWTSKSYREEDANVERGLISGNGAF
jgi:hypothetical protein